MKTMKRFGCLLLVLAMVLALGVSGFAASGSGGSITINGAAVGETYSIYKLFDLTYSTLYGEGEDEIDSYSYRVVDEWKTFLESYVDTTLESTLFVIDGNGYLDPTSPIFNELDNSDVMAAFAKAALEYAESAEIQAAAASEAEDQTVVFGGLDLGWYLVDSSLGTLCMLTSTDPDAEINEKNQKPTLVKYERDLTFDTDEGEFVEKEDSDNNDAMEYVLVINGVTNVSNLVIHDMLDDQLDPSTFANLTVTIYQSADDTTGTKLEENVGYTISWEKLICGEDGTLISGMKSCSFEISIPDSVLEGLPTTAYIVVDYTIELKEDAGQFGEELEDDVYNTASVSYGSASHSEPSEVETMSFGFRLLKYTDVSDFTGIHDYVIHVTLTHDGPENLNDDMYLVLEDEGGNILYYAVFTPYTGGDNAYDYVITGWVTDVNQATTIVEPDSGNELSVTFYFEGVMPEHDSIDMVEGSSNPAVQEDEGTEEGTGANGANVDIYLTLEGAQFIIYKGSENDGYVYATFTEEGNGTYLFAGWTDSRGNATVLVSPDNGLITVEGLHDGTYYVEEIAAPDGYNMLTEPIQIIVDANGNVKMSENGDPLDGKLLAVENNAGSELPGTGGIGTTIFYVIGAILVCGAVVLLVTKRRTSNKDQAEA